MGKYESAIREFAEARELSVQLDDRQGVAFADLHDCIARIELGQLQRAASECNHALSGFTAAHSADEVRSAGAAGAHRSGNATPTRRRHAQPRYRSGWSGSAAERVASLYQWRAARQRLLGQLQRRLHDLSSMCGRYEAANDMERSKAAAALRAPFRTGSENRAQCAIETRAGNFKGAGAASGA